jgi:putative acetyltransferase
MIPADSTIHVEDAISARSLELVQHLFRSYADEFAGSLTETLRVQGFAAEVAGLPGRYAGPSGCLLLATEGNSPAGCVALRDLGNGTCEMKRLYVAPSHRARGVGKLLIRELIRRAEKIGYRRMVLDTFPEMTSALALYREHGFVETAPDWSHQADHPVFMQKPLSVKPASIRTPESGST